MRSIVGQRRDLDKSLARTREYRVLARTTHKQQAGSKAKKDVAPPEAGTDGNGQPSGVQPGLAERPPAAPKPAVAAGFDAAIDAFLAKARSEFTVPPRDASAPKGVYQPTPSTFPVRALFVGVLIGATLMALVVLALRR